MQIPRFGVKQLLIVVTVVALWLATFALPDPANQNAALSAEYGARIVGIHIRSGMMLTVIIAAGFAAIYFRGKRQAFWAGFFVAMLVLYFYNRPDFQHLASYLTAGILLSRHTNADPVNMLTGSVWAGLQLSFSTVAGIIATAIYNHGRSQK